MAAREVGKLTAGNNDLPIRLEPEEACPPATALVVGFQGAALVLAPTVLNVAIAVRSVIGFALVGNGLPAAGHAGFPKPGPGMLSPDTSPRVCRDHGTSVDFSANVPGIVRPGGAGGTRTPGLHSAIVALSQLSYSPVPTRRRIRMELMGLEPMTSTMPLWRSPN